LGKGYGFKDQLAFKRNGSKKGYRKINFAQIKKKDRITRKHKEKCAN
jgi:hypothetical protein